MSAEEMAKSAKKAAFQMATLSTETKNTVLVRVKEQLLKDKEKIIEANKKDMAAAAQKQDLSSALKKRLDLSDSKFRSLTEGIDTLLSLPDPVGKVTLSRQLDQGLNLYRITSPIGVLCIIYEARPEAGVQIASLAIKSGNAIILKGGSEAEHSNRAVYESFQEALKSCADLGVPSGCVQLISTRQEVQGLLSLDKYIDLIIPRGSNQLVRSIQNSTRIPVLGHADGLCSVFVDKSADIEKAIPIIVDSKLQYVAACNALETLLIHQDIFEQIKSKLAQAAIANKIELRADTRSYPKLKEEFKDQASLLKEATPEDFLTEFLEPILAVKIVDSVHEAIEHINEHGSHHTDCILTTDQQNVKLFVSTVDSAGVYHNVSTRFADGFRYGFGAEVGISTNKTHARGPVGLEGLMIYKYHLSGDGQIVDNYAKNVSSFHHSDIPPTLPF